MDSVLLEKGYIPEEIPLSVVQEFMPEFIQLTPTNTKCQQFGRDIRTHPYFEAPPARTFSLEEIKEMMEETGGKLPESLEEWEKMKGQHQRHQRRTQHRPHFPSRTVSPILEPQELFDMEEVD